MIYPGYETISVAAGQTATYEAVYSPLIPTGTDPEIGSISFVNQVARKGRNEDSLVQ